VFGFSGANSQTCYTITATATAVTGCQSTLDNTTNNTTSGAAVIPFNTNIAGRIDAGSDVDHYRFAITTGGTITLTLTTLPANYHLRLVNSAGTVLATSSNSGTTNETINYTATSATTYFARVYPVNTSTFNTTSCYTLRVALGTATKGAEIATEKTEVFPNPAHDVLNVQIKGQAGTSQIQVINAAGGIVMKHTISMANSQINVTNLPSGIYMVNVIRNGKVVSRNKFVKQ
jgi:hypothetical protein